MVEQAEKFFLVLKKNEITCTILHLFCNFVQGNKNFFTTP